MKRTANPELDKILGKEFPCLDYGFVRLIDYMGSDESIVQAARVSYGKGTKSVLQDRGLIRYLFRHQHTTPFEMVEFKFHCKLPIFVARQWIRHRTASVNEYSLRYSRAHNQFYMPEPEVIRAQSTTNRQGRSLDAVPEDLQQKVLAILKKYTTQAWDYWKIDLHNLLHFLRLRLHPTAQYEIRVYAKAMAEILKIAVPLTWEAFEDYSLHAKTFSRIEIEMIKEALAKSAPQNWEEMAQAKGLSKREIREFIEKINTDNN